MLRIAHLWPLLLLGALLAGPVARADETDPLAGDAAEQALQKLVEQRKLIKAREDADKILATHRQSIIARYALAIVFHEEEGNLPRSLNHARAAEKLLTRQFGMAPTLPSAQSWHRKLILLQADILGEMDRREEQLAVLDRHDAIYRPKQERRRIWSLMKLQRFDEAIRLSNYIAENARDEWTRAGGLNGLLAVDGERHDRKAHYATAVRVTGLTGERSCILLHNGALAALASFKFAEAERMSLASIKAPIKDCPSTAHSTLANLYLLRADFQRAMAAVKAARKAGTERRWVQQFEMRHTSWLARLFLTLGHFEQALELTRQILAAPDRVGMTSSTAEAMRVISNTDHLAALAGQREALAEQASARPFSHKLKLGWARARLDLEAWVAQRRASGALRHRDVLSTMVRPYVEMFPPWHAGTLIDLMGAGTTRAAIERARRDELSKAETEPYFSALLGEIAYRRGELGEADKLARLALTTLPKDEVLLRLRTSAWAADTAHKTGDSARAEVLFDEVLDQYPTALRVLGIQLPVKVSAGEGALASQVADRLLSSRRLKLGNLGFAVEAIQAGKTVRICLSKQNGRRYGCSQIDVSAAKNDADKVAMAIDEFHAKVFAPKIDLTQKDINSLDGSAARGTADQLLRDVLGPRPKP